MTPPRLPPQPWLAAGPTQAVIQALTAGGSPVRFVGGCVRDALIGRPVRDIDLATPDPPETVIRLVEAAGLKAVPTGIAHGTVTVVADHRPFEVTTLRRDVETDGRRARVAFTDDWTADAARRDFTMNALSADPDGTVHDPFGGIADLRAGLVRFVGDARARIREDVLRILRFFRFHAHYGAAAPEPAGLAACAELAPLIAGLSAERVRDELLKLLLAPDPAATLAVMEEAGVLREVAQTAAAHPVLARLTGLERGMGHEADAIRRLAALLPAESDAAAALARRLKLRNRDRDRLVAIAASPPGVMPGDSHGDRRRALRRLGPQAYRDAVLVAWARAGGSEAELAAALAVAAEPIPRFPLQGRDALALGLPPGPEIGRLVAAVEAWWEAGDYRADRAACLARLRALSARS